MTSNMNANDILLLSRKFAKNLNSCGFNIAPENIVECRLLITVMI